MADQIFPVNCGFFDAVNNDRLYTANQMNLPYKRVIGNGVFATPAGTPSTDLQVSAPGGGMAITVQAGEGIFAHKWYNNPAVLSITVPPNTGTLQRIDSVIVQVDERISGRVGNIVYRSGTPANPPQPPEINTTDGVTEYRLANVSVAAGATAIDASMINDLRGSVHCPWVTSLIYQVDTSTLFDQFNAAYTNQYNAYTLDFEQYKAQQRDAWEEFVKTLTDQLTVSTNIITYKSSCVTTGPTTFVPINIPSFDPATDLLQVYINGLFAQPGEKYVITGSDILLTNPIDAGNLVYFFVFKSVIGGDIESTVTMMQRMDEEIQGFMADSGWQRIPLSGGVLPGSDSTAPAFRQIGNRVYLRGSVRNVTEADTLLCILPVEMRPANNHDYLSAALADPDINIPVGIRVEADTGKVIALAPTGPILSNYTISLATAFLAATGNPQSLIYDFKGTVANYAALPTSGQKAGDVYKILAADAAHNIPAGGKVMWDGLEWEILSPDGGSSEPPYQEFTDGGWRWRIWNSGQLEAWYSANNVELRVVNPKGQVFESDKTTIAFPAGLVFADYDAVQVQFNVSARLFGAWSNVYSVAAEGIQYSAFSATDRGLQTCYKVSAYLTGETGI